MTRILLIVGGGIAAYKAAELIRLLKTRGHAVRCVMTESAHHFVTPMTLAALSEDKVYTTLWDLKDEAEMGHIQLSREADLVVVAPGTARRRRPPTHPARAGAHAPFDFDQLARLLRSEGAAHLPTAVRRQSDR